MHCANEPEVTRYLELGDHIYHNRCVDVSDDSFICGRSRNEHFRKLLEVRKSSLIKEACHNYKHSHKCETQSKNSLQLKLGLQGSLCSMAPDELRMAIKILLVNDKSLVQFKHTQLSSILEEETNDIIIDTTEVKMAEKWTFDPFSKIAEQPDEASFQCKEGCINYGCDLLKMCRHERSKRLREERIRRMNLKKKETQEMNKQREARLRSLINRVQVQKDNGRSMYIGSLLQ